MAEITPGQDTCSHELRGMRLIRNVGEVMPWVDRFAQVPPETVAVAVGALLEVSGSRERAYRLAYTLFDAQLLRAPEPDRWVPDGDGCTQPQWDMPTGTVTAWTGGISTGIFGYREDLDEVERQAHAMLAAVGYAREFAAKAAERTEQE